MPKNVKRTISILAKDTDEREQPLGVFAPAIVANLRMVDLQLRKAGLTELNGFLLANEDQWSARNEAFDAFRAAGQFFEQHPESIPFSDILTRTFPGILQALDSIPEDVQVRFTLVEVGHDGLDHGSVVGLGGRPRYWGGPIRQEVGEECRSGATTDQCPVEPRITDEHG